MGRSLFPEIPLPPEVCLVAAESFGPVEVCARALRDLSSFARDMSQEDRVQSMSSGIQVSITVKERLGEAEKRVAELSHIEVPEHEVVAEDPKHRRAKKKKVARN